MTVVIALHQMHLAMRMADYIIALAAGQIIVKAPVSEVVPVDLDRIFQAEMKYASLPNPAITFPQALSGCQ